MDSQTGPSKCHLAGPPATIAAMQMVAGSHNVGWHTRAADVASVDTNLARQ